MPKVIFPVKLCYRENATDHSCQGLTWTYILIDKKSLKDTLTEIHLQILIPNISIIYYATFIFAQNCLCLLCQALRPIRNKLYEGRPINKLQNGIILLIFKI